MNKKARPGGVWVADGRDESLRLGCEVLTGGISTIETASAFAIYQKL